MPETKSVIADEKLLKAINKFYGFPGSISTLESAVEFLMNSRFISSDSSKSYYFDTILTSGYSTICTTKNSEVKEIAIDFNVRQIEGLKEICEALLNGVPGKTMEEVFRLLPKEGDENAGTA